MQASFLAPVLGVPAVLDAPLTVALPAGAAFTRGGLATYYDNSGNLRDAASNVARFDADPYSGAPLGLRIEGARQQFVRNQTASGAVVGVVGSGGAFPTHWNTTNSGSGVQWEILGTTVIDGVTCLRVRAFGTAIGTASYFLSFEAAASTNPTLAAVGQVWSSAMFVGLEAGSVTPFGNVKAGMIERNGATFTAQNGLTLIKSTLNAGWFGRYTYRRTLSNAATTRVSPALILDVLNGAVFDATFLVGLPEIAQVPVMGSPLRTDAAVPAEVVFGPLGASMSAGTLVAEGVAAPVAGAQVLAVLDDGTADNSITIRRTATFEVYATVRTAGAQVADMLLGSWMNTARNVAAVSWAAGSITACFGAGAPVVVAAAGPVGLTTWRAGCNLAGGSQWGGTVARITVLSGTANTVARTAPLFLHDDFRRADGPPVASNGGAYQYIVVPFTAPTSAVREPVISGNALITPSAANESTTGVTAAYLGADLGRTCDGMDILFSMTSGPANFGNVTIVSSALGLGTVPNITNNSLHISITDSTYIVAYFENGALINIGNLAFPQVSWGDKYQSGFRYVGEGFFVLTLPDGTSPVIHSPAMASKMGRFLTWEHYIAKSGATPGAWPTIHAIGAT
jgi:hypothetical protein